MIIYPSAGLNIEEMTQSNIHYITPEMFGDIGIDKEQDTQALQKAIDYANEYYKKNNSQIVIRADGNYHLSVYSYHKPDGTNYGIYSLMMKDGVILKGSGKLIIPEHAYGAGAFYRALSSNMADGSRLKDCLIADITIDGEVQNKVPGGQASNILLECDSNVEIRNVKSINSNGQGIQLRGTITKSASNLKVINCAVTNCSGIGIQCALFDGLIISNNYVTKCKNNGIDLYGDMGVAGASLPAGGTNFTVIGNVISYSLNGIFPETVSNGVIANNTINNCVESGVHVNRIRNQPRNIQISSNVISDQPIGVRVSGDMRGVHISDNTLTGLTTAFIQLGMGGNCSYVSIHQNYFKPMTAGVPIILLHGGTMSFISVWDNLIEGTSGLVKADLVVNQATNVTLSVKIGEWRGWATTFDFPLANRVVTPEMFGAKGDGVTNDQAALQSALNYSIKTGIDLQLAAVTYFCDGPLTKSSANNTRNCPNIKGQGMSINGTPRTTLKFSKGSYFKVSGVQGTLTGAVFENFVIKGSDMTTDTPFIISSTGYLTVRNVAFETCLIGASLRNDSTLGFTEFCRFDGCVFRSDCHQALSYEKTTGQDSFRESGLIGCIIENTAPSTLCHIHIGPGAKVYNAPMDFAANVGPTMTSIINHEGASVSNVYGNIRIEKMGTAATCELVSGNKLYFVGGLNVLTQTINTTNAIYCYKVRVNNDGSLNCDRIPFGFQKKINTGNSIASFSNGESALVEVTFIAANYEYKYLLAVSENRTNGAGNVAILATYTTLNNPLNWGPPAFSFANGNLIVTNSNYIDDIVTVQGFINYTGTRSQYRLN